MIGPYTHPNASNLIDVLVPLPVSYRNNLKILLAYGDLALFRDSQLFGGKSYVTIQMR